MIFVNKDAFTLAKKPGFSLPLSDLPKRTYLNKPGFWVLNAIFYFNEKILLDSRSNKSPNK
jgi:hypothetical protein